MNPLKSLMACALVALGLLASPAAAEWRSFTAGGRTYYVDAAQFAALKVGSGEAAVFGGIIKDKKTVDQSTVLTGAKLKLKAANQYVLVQGGKETEAKVAQSVTNVDGVGGNEPKPKTTKPKGTTDPNAPPAGVDADVWAMINRNPDFKGKPKAERTKAAKALQLYKKSAAEAFAKLAAADAAQGDKAASAVVKAATGKTALDAQTLEVISKTPDVALVLDAKPKANPVGNTPQPISAGTGGLTEDEIKASKEDPINILTQKLGSDGRADIEARLGRFLTRTGDKAFIDPKYGDSPEGKDAKVKERMSAVVKSWIDQKIKEDKAAAVSKLMYVMGFDQGLPSWAKPHLTLAVMADPLHGYPKMLDEGMKGWTAAVAKTSADAKGRIAPGAYAGAPVKLEDWVFAFFEASAEAARSAYDDRRQKDDLKGRIGQNSDDGATPAYGSSGRKPMSGSRGFGVKDMFEDGAVVGNVIVNKAGEYRRISVKIYTRRDPATGKMIDELGIFDISNPGGPNSPGDVYGQRFPLNQRGESVFRLDDSVKDSLKYKLTMKDGKITFGTPDGNSIIETSHKELIERREGQVRASKTIREIDGKSFKVIPQGGKYGGLLYYPVDGEGRLTGSSRTPSNMAFLNTLGGDGFSERLAPPQTALGFIGKPKEDKSNFYYMVWNDELKYFEPTKCVKDSADKPCEFKAPPPPATTVKPTTTPGEVTPGTTNPTTTTPGETQPGTTTPVTSDPSTVNGEQPGSEGALKACLLQEEQFGHNLKRQADKNGWVHFLTKKDGNAFQLCLNGRQSMFVQGIPVWNTARINGPHLILETVYAKTQVPADEVVSGNVKGAEYNVPGRPTYELTSRQMHYVELAKITPEAISAAGGGNGTVYADQTAWVTYQMDVRKPAEAKVMEIRIKDLDVAKAEALIRKGYGIGNVPNTSFGDKDSINAIVAFVKTELVRYKDKPLVKNPKITIELYVKKDATEPNPVTVVTITAAGNKTGVDIKGEDIIDALSYDELIYCYQNHKLEARAAVHNKHLSGAK